MMEENIKEFWQNMKLIEDEIADLIVDGSVIHKSEELGKYSLGGDQVKVLKGSPWSFERCVLLLNKYDGSKRVGDIQFHSLPIWVRGYDLPLSMIRREVAEQRGNWLDTFLESDLGNESGGWGRFLRFKVNIDVGKPLIRGVLVTEGLTKDKYFTKLKYKRLPNLCFWCSCLGHVDKDYESKDVDENPSTKPYKDWLRASPLTTRSNRKGGYGASSRVSVKNKSTQGVGTCGSIKDGSGIKFSGSKSGFQ
ncbi:hypothetical protein REPUB_Repub10bG0023600 [Reevesia pubescens]